MQTSGCVISVYLYVSWIYFVKLSICNCCRRRGLHWMEPSSCWLHRKRNNNRNINGFSMHVKYAWAIIAEFLTCIVSMDYNNTNRSNYQKQLFSMKNWIYSTMEWQWNQNWFVGAVCDFFFRFICSPNSATDIIWYRPGLLNWFWRNLQQFKIVFVVVLFFFCWSSLLLVHMPSNRRHGCWYFNQAIETTRHMQYF